MHDTPKRQIGAEIEVTPEMIEAGVAATYECDFKHDTRESIVRHIYAAMIEARRVIRSARNSWPSSSGR